MNQRDIDILALRGGAIGEVNEQSSTEEMFQNNTLRPVLKAQNELFIESFINYINKHKNDFHALTAEKKLLFIENAIHKDIKFRNALKGMVIAFFTVEEFREYARNSSNLNKRMMNMVIERIKDQVQMLDASVTE